MGVSFICGGNGSIVVKTADLPLVSSHWQIYHLKLYQVHLAMNMIQNHNFMVMGTDCTGLFPQLPKEFNILLRNGGML